VLRALIVVLLAATTALAAPLPPHWRGCPTLPGAAGRVIDGDTFVATLTILPNLIAKETIRVLGVDAPELNTPDGPKAREFTERWLLEGNWAVVVVTCRRDAFGRLLGDVKRASDGADLAEALLKAGLAKPWRGHKE
jgi:endonuclease YncB( thermonuclease family)